MQAHKLSAHCKMDIETSVDRSSDFQYSCASGVVYANYKSAIDVFEGGAGIRTVPGFSANATGQYCHAWNEAAAHKVVQLVYFAPIPPRS